MFTHKTPRVFFRLFHHSYIWYTTYTSTCGTCVIYLYSTSYEVVLGSIIPIIRTTERRQCCCDILRSNDYSDGPGTASSYQSSSCRCVVHSGRIYHVEYTDSRVFPDQRRRNTQHRHHLHPDSTCLHPLNLACLRSVAARKASPS